MGLYCIAWYCMILYGNDLYAEGGSAGGLLMGAILNIEGNI